MYFLAAILLMVAVWIIGAPYLISAKDDLEVAAGYFLIAISIPVFVWIVKKIWFDQQANISKLKELLK